MGRSSENSFPFNRPCAFVLSDARSLRFFLVHPGDFVSRVAERMQYFIKLGMYGLGVAMLRALDHQRHKPCR